MSLERHFALRESFQKRKKCAVMFLRAVLVYCHSGWLNFLSGRQVTPGPVQCVVTHPSSRVKLWWCVMCIAGRQPSCKGLSRDISMIYNNTKVHFLELLQLDGGGACAEAGELSRL